MAEHDYMRDFVRDYDQRRPAQDYPMRIDLAYPERSSRLLALLNLTGVKAILLIPHSVILAFMSIAVVFVMIFANLAALFLGRYPRGMYDFVLGFLRWQTRVSAYFFGIVDRYPPFDLR